MYKRKKILKILKFALAFIAVLPLILSFILAYFQIAPEDKGERLSFNEKGEFSIILIAGLLEQNGICENTKTYLYNLINTEKPQLVILGGNNIAVEDTLSELFLQSTLKVIDSIANVFNSTKTYFTVLYGNSDTEGLYDKTTQIKRYMKSDYFVGSIEENDFLKVYYDRKGDAVGNFKINIHNGNSIGYSIYLIDSQGSNKDLSAENEWIKNTAESNYAVVFSHKYLYSTENIKSYVGSQAAYNSIFPQNFLIDKVTGIFSCENNSNFTFTKSGYNNDVILSATPLTVKADSGEVKNYSARKIVLYTSGGLLTYQIGIGNYLSL